MKKIFLLFLLLSLKQVNAQNYITIPDANFVTYLQNKFPSAMNGNQMDTTSPAITGYTGFIDIQLKSIADVTGIEYFLSADTILVGSNPITFIAKLPPATTYFRCDATLLTSLPALPGTLKELYTTETPLTSLPALPGSLTYLDCNHDSLTSLPTLPAGLTGVDCHDNRITALPTIPSTVGGIYCQMNQLTSLPALPNNMQTLDCSSNYLTSLPALPNALHYLTISHNQITALPALPSHLWIMDCSFNPLTSIPPVGTFFTTLYCQNDSLTSLPALPVGMDWVDCRNNKISCFSPFYNNLFKLELSGNPFTCLPNYVNAMDSITLTYPLCASGNVHNCPIVDTCPPNITYYLTKDSFALFSWTIHPVYSLNCDSAVWYWGDGTSTPGFNPSHTYASPGSYNICATVFSNCGDSFNVCQIDTLYRMASNNSVVYVNIEGDVAGIVESGAASRPITFYPNPASTDLELRGDERNDYEVILYDVTGNAIFTRKFKGKTTLSINGYPNGVYTLRVTYLDKIDYGRLIIAR